MADTRYVEITIEGISCQDVLAIKGHEEVSRLFEFEIEVIVDAPVPDLAVLMGVRAELTIRDVAGNQRLITGIVAEATVTARDSDDNVLGKFLIKPAIYRQALGRDCWSAQEVKVLDVVKEVLADYPGPIRYDVGGSYPSYPYRVQYREDDWTYISRITEEEGIYYWFDHGDGESELVFADTSPSAPAIEGVPLITYAPASNMRPDQEAVVELSFVAAAASHRFSARSFDMKQPEKSIAAEVGDGTHEHYDAPGAGTPDPAILAERVRVGLEGAKAHRAQLKGLATTVRLFPGRHFEVFAHPVPALNGAFFITRVDIVGDAKIGVSSSFRAIPKDVPYRALRTTPEAKQAGLQMGQVIGPDGQEVHPDEFGRVRVWMHWDRFGVKNEKGGTWVRICQRGSPGSMLLPRMGWNVATFNEEGGVDAPSTMCRIHDAEHPPEYALPANKTRVVYKTATTIGGGPLNEIYFEDRAGAEEMFIKASRDMNVRALHRKTEVVKNDSLRQVDGNYLLNIDASLIERVLQDQTVSVGGNEQLVTQGRHTKNVDQNETRSIGGSRSLKVGDSNVTSVDKDRTLSVGSAMIDLTLGTITTTGNHSMATVGGVMARVSNATIAEDTAKVAISAIGGAKIEIADQSRPMDVGEQLRELIGGGMICKTNGRFFDNAEKTSDWLVIGSLTADGPKVRIEAEQKIVIKCGNSRLLIDDKQIRIEAANLDLSGAHIDADTSGKLTHN